MRNRWFTAALAATLASGTIASANERAPDQPALFDTEGYRIARYRSPVTLDPAPAMRLSLHDALALDPERDALFIDVMPVEGGVRDSGSGVWRQSQSHFTISGAQWHPEAGRAPSDQDLWQALETAARGAVPDKPVVLFCRADCWMSWNAARRLAALGLANVWWFAEGTDGWHGAGRRLVIAEPVIVPASTDPREEN